MHRCQLEPRLIQPAIEDENDLVFEYHINGAGTVMGGVVFAASAVAPSVLGDYNGNGTVDAADYVVWRNGGPLQNEGMTPGNVTADDYTFWRSRFGMSAAAGSARSAFVASAVPEPSAALLLVAGMVAASLQQCRRRDELAGYGR